MNNSKISIIIPVFNGVQYLDYCLQSLIRQYNNNFEIIIINDASTDNSLEILYKYSKLYNYITVYNNNVNKGLSYCRNFGISASKGNYLMFIDCDDWISENAVYDIQNIIETNYPDIIIGKIKGVPEANIEKVYADPDIHLYIDSNQLGNSLIEMHKQNFKIAPCVKYIVSKEFITKNNFHFYNINFEDEIWSVQLLINSKKISIYNSYFYNYRLHKNGLSSRKDFDLINAHLLLVDYLVKLHSNIDDKLKQDFIIKRIEHILLLLKNKIILNKDNQKFIINQMNKHINAIGEKNITTIIKNF